MASLVERRRFSSDFSSAHNEKPAQSNSLAANSSLIIDKDTYTFDPILEKVSDNSFVPLQGHRRSKSGSRSLKHLSLTSNSNPQSPNDFVEELGRRITDMSRTIKSDSTSEDVWAQLQQKEADLLLAAELGKALLEKNEELTKQQERLVEQYSSKLEALEQEKHLLRRRLQATEEDSEARILELQNDVKDLSNKLDAKDTNVKQSDREKTTLIAELTAQNTRLTAQLKDASQTELQLTAQMQGLKDQCSLRKTSLQDHVSSLEALKEELQLVSDKKTELERRLQAALSDRDSLASQLEEACDRIAMLERHIREQELKYHNSFTDMERLQRENSTLNERLGGGANSGPFALRRSLHAEMENGQGEDGSVQPPPASEILHVYKQLRQLCTHLRSSHDDDSGLHSDLSLSSLEGEQGVQLRAGVLAEVAEELSLLVAGLEGVRFKDVLEKLSHQLHERDRDLHERNQQILDLQKKISVWEVELASAREEANNAKADAAGGEMARDAAVAEARAARDAAVARRTRAESDAARARVELAQAAGQLLEAVRQKVELSQQLDQWQMDMQELIEEQMKNKLVSQERKRKMANNGKAESVTTSTTNKILGFFQR